MVTRRRCDMTSSRSIPTVGPRVANRPMAPVPPVQSSEPDPQHLYGRAAVVRGAIPREDFGSRF